MPSAVSLLPSAPIAVAVRVMPPLPTAPIALTASRAVSSLCFPSARIALTDFCLISGLVSLSYNSASSAASV